MLKTIRRYRKSLIGVLAIASVCLVMTGFGIDFMLESNTNYAIKIDDIEIPYTEYYEERQSTLRRYQQILGEKYNELQDSLLANMGEQLRDRFITNTLINREAEKRDLFISDEEIREYINRLFSGDLNQYSAYLNTNNLRPADFERKIGQELLREQFEELLQQSSFASTREARSLIEIEGTTYDVKYLEFKPTNFIKDIVEPSDEELAAFFDDNAIDYEVPSKVTYSYVTISPRDAYDKVEVFDEDVEFEYVEKKDEYKTKAEYLVSHLKLSFPAEDDPALLLEVKERAQEALTRAQSGEPFEELVAQYSDDIETSLTGGELGWITRGTQIKEFDDAVFALEEPGTTDLIETESGYQIANVKEIKPARTKTLEEVRDEIVQQIREREAPAYAAALAQDLFDQWATEGSSLEEFAKANNLEIKTTPDYQEKRDPPALKGLTTQVMDFIEDKQQLLDVGERSVLVEVIDFKEANIPTFDEVKSRVLVQYKLKKSKEIARERAEEALAKIQDGTFEGVEKAASELSMKVLERKNLNRTAPIGDVFGNEDVTREIFSVSKTPSQPKSLHEFAENLYVISVSNVVKPEPSEIDKKIDQYRAKESTNIKQVLMASLLNRLKDQSEIDINPAIMSE